VDPSHRLVRTTNCIFHMSGSDEPMRKSGNVGSLDQDEVSNVYLILATLHRDERASKGLRS